MNKKIFDVVLLLALPASGKSEVRKYLEYLPLEQRINEFHMGPNIQLDDFPYVHLMRRIDDELVALKQQRMFYHSGEKPFINPKDWGTLIELVNQDYADVISKIPVKPVSAAQYYLERIENAAISLGIPKRLSTLSSAIFHALVQTLEKECAEMLKEKHKLQAESLEGKTIVIEFARGGADGAKMPLTNSCGYQYSLAKLSEAILEKAVIIYVWVEPEEARRRNFARAKVGEEGSILHHGVPLDVMLGDYGCDDIDWLLKNSKQPGTVTVESSGRTFYLPLARFDNRIDKTSFLRDDPLVWKPEQIKSVHDGIRDGLVKMGKTA